MKKVGNFCLFLSGLAMLACQGDVAPPDEPPPPPPAGPEPAFLVSELLIPSNNEEVELFGQDYNQDGVIDDDDNALLDLSELPDRLATLSFLAQLIGLDIDISIDLDLQASITETLENGALILGSQLSEDLLLEDEGTFFVFPADVLGSEVPLFDGTDELDPLIPLPFSAKLIDSQDGIAFQTDPGNFFFALPLEGAALLPLENTIFTGTILDPVVEEGFLASSSGIQNGTFSGTIQASEFAKQLEALGAAFAAEDSELLDFLDDNGNGKLDAVFDQASGSFSENELSLIFDIDLNDGRPDDPSGFIGDLFRLDIDGDGRADSMGIGIGLQATSALVP